LPQILMVQAVRETPASCCTHKDTNLEGFERQVKGHNRQQRVEEAEVSSRLEIEILTQSSGNVLQYRCIIARKVGNNNPNPLPLTDCMGDKWEYS